MARDPIICLRVPPALDAQLRAQADATGSTLTAIIVDALTAALEPATPPRPIRLVKAKPAAKPAAGVPCEHRVRSGSFCKKCQRIIP